MFTIKRKNPNCFEPITPLREIPCDIPLFVEAIDQGISIIWKTKIREMRSTWILPAMFDNFTTPTFCYRNDANIIHCLKSLMKQRLAIFWNARNLTIILRISAPKVLSDVKAWLKGFMGLMPFFSTHISGKDAKPKESKRNNVRFVHIALIRRDPFEMNSILDKKIWAIVNPFQLFLAIGQNFW